MMRLRTISLLLVLLIVGTLPLVAQTEFYARKFLLPYPSPGVTWGEAVGGVDFDGDGLLEIYAVNTNSLDGAAELVPVIYKWEINSAGDTWSIVWGDTLNNILAQNSWPALTSGDWDQDGKMEIIWSPVNNYVIGNELPDRLIVYEEKGDGSDVMGVDDGTEGAFRPNARWKIETTPSYNSTNGGLRLFYMMLHDLDSDGSLELVFCDRASSLAGVGYKFGLISVSTIPDNGNGSEVWTLEASGKGLPTAANTVYDVAVLDSTVYFFHATTAGTVSRIRWRDGQYKIDSASVAITPLSPATLSGGWKNVQVVDLDGDGTKEMIGAGYGGNSTNRIWILQVRSGGDSLVATELFDPTSLVGASRLLGSVVGDIDADGKLDVIFGSRDSNPLSALVRVEYKGSGAVTATASYDFSILEQGYGSTAGQQRPDFFALMNLDADPDLEVMYGIGYTNDLNYDFPMIILDRLTVAGTIETITAVRVSTNPNLTPDRTGQTVTVLGTVTSTNQTASANRFSYSIQDAGAGINITKGSQTGGGPVYKVGDRVIVTGTLGQNTGTTQINIGGDLATNVIPVGPVYRVTPITLTINQFLANPETYESRLIKFNGVAKAPTSVAWPAPAFSANMTFWDGADSVTLRIDNDTNIDDSTEVLYPVNVQGNGGQFDNSSPYTSGYQIITNFYSDFTQGVSTTPNPKIALVAPANGSTITLTDSAQIVTFSWKQTVDLDGDPLTYAWARIGGAPASTGADTTYNRTAAQLLPLFSTSDTLILRWRAAARENKTGGVTIYSLDTSSVILVRDRNLLDVEGYEAIPTEFALDQNYPNPFNPTTTIRVALPNAAFVTLKVYNMLGQEVATLLEGENNAGYVTTVWNGRDQYGISVASGVYIYRVVARPVGGGEEFVTQKKMMMLK